MASSLRWQRIVRVLFWIVALVLLFVSSVRLYRQHFPPRGEEDYSDPVLLQDLATASLAGPEQPPETGSWPQWRGPNRDGVSPETGLLTKWPADGPKLLWRANAGPGYSSLAIAWGRVCTLLQDGADEVVVCWDADSGKELWRFRYQALFDDSFGSGPRSTPSIDGDRVYTVGGTGIFHCLKLDNGGRLWRHDLLDEFGATNLRWGVSFSPLVEGDLVFTNPGGSRGRSLAAFDKNTGQLVWKTFGDPAGYSSPIAVTIAGVRQVVFFTGNHLVSVTPAEGTVLWQLPWETSYGCNIATPICRGEYLFISSGYSRGCALVKVSKGVLGWDVKRVYENNRMNNHFSSSVLWGEHLYGFNDAILTCMEFRTGRVVWRERGGFKKGSLLVADGHLIILGEEGQMSIAPATPEGYREKASFACSNDKCWTVPVVAGGRLYVRDEKQVVCYDLRR
jgi:outer membrane protein assembly factor BamB